MISTWSLVIITIAVVVVVGFLIITLLKVNKVLDKTSVLVNNLNQELPFILTDLRRTSTNVNALVESVAHGAQQAAAGVDFVTSFKFGTALELLGIAQRGLGFLKKIMKRGEK